MYPHSFAITRRIGLRKSWSSLLSEIREGFKSRDRLILTVLVLGFYSVWSLADMRDLQTNPLASKALRIASVLFAFVLASRVFILREARRAFFGKTVLPIVVFFCTCVLSMPVSEWPLLTAYKAFEILAVIMLIVEGTIDEKSRPESLLRWMIGLIVAATCVVWLEGLMFPGLAWTTPSLARSVNVRMLHGIFPIVNPNTLGFFGGILLLYGVCYLLARRRWRVMSYVLPVLGTMTIVASYSRTTLFATCVALFVMLIACRKFGATVLLLGVLSVAMASGSIRTNIIRYVDRGRESKNLNDFTSNRLELWQKSIEQYSSSMVLGKGYGVGFRAEGVGPVKNAHNSIVELFAGTGLLGVCAWLYMMVNLWIQLILLAWGRRSRLTHQHMAALTLMVYLFVFSVGNTRGVYLDYPTLLLAGIVVYAEKKRASSIPSRRLTIAERISGPTRRRSLPHLLRGMSGDIRCGDSLKRTPTSGSGRLHPETIRRCGD